MSNSDAETVRKAVVLLNFGGPRSLQEIPDFLYEILRDPHTIQLPIPLWLQNLLARLVANKRSPVVVQQYEAIGGKSPIVTSTEQQRLHLRAALEERNSTTSVYAVHRYIPGNATRVVRQILQDHVNDIFLIPLYPHYSRTTTGSSIEQFCGELKKMGFSGGIRALRSYGQHPDYISGLSQQLQKALTKHKLDPFSTRILCSAHGIPQSYVERGDPYLMELIASVEALRKNFDQWQFELCFQSRIGPAKWLQPYTDEMIKELGKGEVRAILFIPLSFVNDHLETLYEVDHIYFDLVRSFEITPYRLPALETHPRLIQLFREQTLLWEKEAQGVDPALLLPPNQNFRRRNQWILILSGLVFLIILVLLLRF